jgi:hypothetical protein
MDLKDFPRIAIQVGKPESVLPREATGYVLYGLFEDALFLQPLFPPRDSIDRLDFDAEMVHPTDFFCG